MRLIGWAAGLVAAGMATLGTALAAGGEIADPAKIPGLTDATRTAYLRFLESGPSRAFAIGPAGTFGASAEQPDMFAAMAAAIWQCNRVARTRCKVHAANSTLVLPDYADFARDSARATAYVRAAELRGVFGNEDREYGIPEQKEPRRGDYHQPTPLTLPGASTITTSALVKALQSPEPPALIDVLPERFGHVTLPDAIWLRSAGNYFGPKDAEVTALLGEMLAKIVTSKRSMLVFFCESPNCWLSYNASLRAAELGYSNVHWYRGGLAAWREAKLPTVKAVLEGQF
ncbi:rhodanese-like domain-containing protein [Desertibaculum subflavum]|uniref:rhodanese-like domain-containing protein n=1 Tax=Desertibaculum subflavum TaxID=2268458 RepID=UPI0013C49C95